MIERQADRLTDRQTDAMAAVDPMVEHLVQGLMNNLRHATFTNDAVAEAFVDASGQLDEDGDVPQESDIHVRT